MSTTRRSLRLRQEQEKQQTSSTSSLKMEIETAASEALNHNDDEEEEKITKTTPVSRRGRKSIKQQPKSQEKQQKTPSSSAAVKEVAVLLLPATDQIVSSNSGGEIENESTPLAAKTNGVTTTSNSPAKVLTEIPTNAPPPPPVVNGNVQSPQSVESIEKTTNGGEAAIAVDKETTDKAPVTNNTEEVEMVVEKEKTAVEDENIMLDESKIDTDVAAVLGIKRGIQRRSRASAAAATSASNGKGKSKRPRESDSDDYDDDDEEDEFDEDTDDDMTDYGEFESDAENDTENKTGGAGETSLLDGDTDGLNGSTASVGNKSKTEKDKMRRRLPLSIKELIDYHSSNGKSIKEIVSKINQVCKSEEKVSYGYVQKYLYRKKLEATTAKKARYYRKKYGFVYRRMRRKPVLTEHHRGLRVQWCSKYVDDSFDKDIFIGKTALKPFLASLNQLKGQPHDPAQPKQQTTTLHLWGAISRKGASPLQIFDGSLTTAMYLEILLENIVPFIAENFPSGHRFHQDNNPKHSAKLSQEFLASTGINWVKSPPRSHDLNPIELVWTDLIQNVSKRLPKTLGQVVVAVKDYWKTLTPEKCCEFIDKLVDTVPKVIDKSGEWISLS